MLVLLMSITLSFPSNEFPFSCLTAQLALFFSALALHSGARTWEGRATTAGWAPLTSLSPVVPSLGPCQETETSPRMGLSTCLAGLTSTHLPTFHPSFTRVSEIPFSQILSLLPASQVLELVRRISKASGLCSALCPI